MLRRLKVPIVLLVAVAAIGWLVVSSVARNDLYMSTLAQWDPARARRGSVRLMGFVAEGSIREQPQLLVTDFVMRDDSGKLTLPMRFRGVTPGLFREGAAVVASGTLGSDGTFEATDLMTKCPSKYEGVDTPHGKEGPAPASPAPGATVAAAAGGAPGSPFMGGPTLATTADTARPAGP